jgi:tetratricopeptide (TPR) repeat protein
MRAGIFAMIVCAAPIADARPSPEQAAKDAAYSAFQVSDYDTAIEKYKQAYKLTGDARLFYNVALAYKKRFELHRQRADLVEARDYFHRFAELVDPDIPQYKRDATQIIQMRELARGYVTELDAELTKLDHPPPPPPAPLPPQDHRSTLGLTLVVGSGLLLAGGGVSGALALSNEHDARDAEKIGDIDRTNVLGHRANRFALATDVLIGSALVAGGIGLYLTLRHDKHPRPTVGLVLTPGGAALAGTY